MFIGPTPVCRPAFDCGYRSVLNSFRCKFVMVRYKLLDTKAFQLWILAEEREFLDSSLKDFDLKVNFDDMWDKGTNKHVLSKISKSLVHNKQGERITLLAAGGWSNLYPAQEKPSAKSAKQKKKGGGNQKDDGPKTADAGQSKGEEKDEEDEEEKPQDEKEQPQDEEEKPQEDTDVDSGDDDNNASENQPRKKRRKRSSTNNAAATGSNKRLPEAAAASSKKKKRKTTVNSSTTVPKIPVSHLEVAEKKMVKEVYHHLVEEYHDDSHSLAFKNASFNRYFYVFIYLFIS